MCLGAAAAGGVLPLLPVCGLAGGDAGQPDAPQEAVTQQHARVSAQQLQLQAADGQQHPTHRRGDH